MTGILITIFGAGVNVLAFVGTNYAFSKSVLGEAESEHKRQNLGVEKLQKPKGNKAKAYIINVDEAVLEYYRVLVKRTKPLPPELELSDFYHLSEFQKDGELFCTTAGTGLTTYTKR